MALTLGLAGLLPFMAGGLGVWLPVLGDWRFGLPVLVSGYAALIAAFLGGVRWGAAMQAPDADYLSRYLLLAIMPTPAGAGDAGFAATPCAVFIAVHVYRPRRGRYAGGAARSFGWLVCALAGFADKHCVAVPVIHAAA